MRCRHVRCAICLCFALLASTCCGKPRECSQWKLISTAITAQSLNTSYHSPSGLCKVCTCRSLWPTDAGAAGVPCSVLPPPGPPSTASASIPRSCSLMVVPMGLPYLKGDETYFGIPLDVVTLSSYPDPLTGYSVRLTDVHSSAQPIMRQTDQVTHGLQGSGWEPKCWTRRGAMVSSPSSGSCQRAVHQEDLLYALRVLHWVSQ